MIKRALVITPFSPVPDSAGHRKRILSTIRILQGLGYQVDILFTCLDRFWTHESNRQHQAALAALAEHVHFVCGQEAPSAPTGEDFGIDDWIQPGFEDAAAWLADRTAYDLVFCNYVFLSKLLTKFGSHVFKIIDTHDKFGGRAAMLRKHGSKVEFFHTSVEQERIAADRADLVLAIKDQEAGYFEQLSETPVIVLPYCEPSKPRPLSSSKLPHKEGVRLGFFGSSNWINRTNFLHFMDEYRKYPRFLNGDTLDIHIYGSLCDVLVDFQCPGVTMGGLVATVEEFYDAVDCVLIPQNFSTGLKIKMAEALAFHIPILAHVHAAEGLIFDPENNILFHDFKALIDACYQLNDRQGQLADIRKDVITAQSVLQDRTQQAIDQIADAVERTRTLITLVFDMDLARESTLYFCAMRSVCTGLSNNCRILLIGVGTRQPEDFETLVKGWRYAVGLCCATDDGATAHLRAQDHGDLLVAKHMQNSLSELALGERRCINFDALVAFQASARGLICDTSSRVDITVQSKFQDNCQHLKMSTEQITILHLRCPPWEGTFGGKVTKSTVLPYPVIAQPCGGAPYAHTQSLTVCPCGKCGDLSVSEFESKIIRNGIFPQMVIDESNGAADFSLLFELLYWNRIPICRGRRSGAEPPIGESFYSSSIFGLVDPQHLPQVPRISWAHSGFPELQGVLRVSVKQHAKVTS
jgi:hypothetical protein